MGRIGQLLIKNHRGFFVYKGIFLVTGDDLGLDFGGFHWVLMGVSVFFRLVMMKRGRIVSVVEKESNLRLMRR